MHDVTVEIESLSVTSDGASPPDGLSFARATEAALQSLIERRAPSSPFAAMSAAHVTVPTVEIPPGASVEQIAHELALAIYHVLGR